MVALNPFRFEWSNGPLNRLHPISKLLCLLFLSTATMNAVPIRLMAIAIALPLLIVHAGLIIKPILLNTRFILPLGIFILLFRVFDPSHPGVFVFSELLPSAIYVARLALAYLLADLFFRTTSTTCLSDSLTAMLRGCLKREEIDPGFYMSLVIAFIPRSFEAYTKALEAAKARGFQAKKAGFRGVGVFIESFILSSIRSAIRSAGALEARGYNPARTVQSRKATRADFLIPLLVATASCLLVFLV